MKAGGVTVEEMREVFNLGMGFVAVSPADEVDRVRNAAGRAGIETWIAGEVRTGGREVRFT
jgi:phosphoribosylaminoimidazole (AIR) synthetase